MIDEKLNHIDGHFCCDIWHMLSELEILAWSLNDLMIANVPTKHSIELKVERPIYYQLRTMSPKSYQILVQEV